MKNSLPRVSFRSLFHFQIETKATMMNNMNYHQNRRTPYVTRKRFFLTLLFLNSFLGCVYYVHEQNSSLSANQIQSNGLMEIKLTNALRAIRSTLENEYNYEDVVRFYQLVHDEYALGMRCARPNVTEQTAAVRNVSLVRKSSRSLRENFYNFVIDNAQQCANEPVDLLILVVSKSENYQTRDAIRRTWASGKQLGIYSTMKIKYLFLLDLDEKLKHQVQLENELFQDIVQVELPQQYTLVTHRVLSLFEWSFRFCRSAKFLFKTDDDIFINLFLLLKFLVPLLGQPTDLSFVPSQMQIYGYRHINPQVYRSTSDLVNARYIVTTDEFPCHHYPDFLAGFGYLIPRKARDAIVYTAYQDPEPFRISDTYFT